MVNARNFFFSAFHLILHAKAMEQTLGANLYAVAKANRLDFGVSLHVACQHSHGVGVVQEPRIGANLFHIGSKFLEYDTGTQRAENTANAQRVANGLAQTVLFGNLKVDNS